MESQSTQFDPAKALEGIPISQLVKAVNSLTQQSFAVGERENCKVIVSKPKMEDIYFYFFDEYDIVLYHGGISEKPEPEKDEQTDRLGFLDYMLCFLFGNSEWSEGEMVNKVLNEIKKTKDIVNIIMPATYTVDELYKAELPEPAYLIEGLVVDIGINLLVSNPHVGKTWLALEMAKSVSRGEPFLQKFKTKKGKVLIIETDEYIGSLKLKMKLLDITNRDNILIWKAGLKLTGEQDNLDLLVNYINEQRISLIIMDSFRSIHNKDENSSQEMTPIVDSLRSVVNRCKCSIILLHHYNKYNSNRKENKIRGSGAIEAGTETILQLEKRGHGEEVYVEQTRNRKDQSSTGFCFKIINSIINDQKKTTLQLAEVTKKLPTQDTAKPLYDFYRECPDPNMSEDEVVNSTHEKTGLSKTTLTKSHRKLIETTFIVLKPGMRLKNKKTYILNENFVLPIPPEPNQSLTAGGP